ncbi:hypothetical protein RF11_13138 [Thelohanellus kitauei]|uniref:Uncharacterized protein n=1 Tax=Thelohanellus kitauei TaxID=669202 RepID=A0A0C2JMF7_THEKT|nr:hypothetical protein RF11_13137 [Thelohanellus kitauei]KII70553.1 hypothetical protein RF11_13138 [Thelohanellus kitauei]
MAEAKFDKRKYSRRHKTDVVRTVPYDCRGRELICKDPQTVIWQNEHVFTLYNNDDRSEKMLVIENEVFKKSGIQRTKSYLWKDKKLQDTMAYTFNQKWMFVNKTGVRGYFIGSQSGCFKITKAEPGHFLNHGRSNKAKELRDA